VVGQAIGDSLPLAIGVAISPVPIIAIILMLLSKRAGANSATYLVGWVAGIAVAVSVVVAVAGTATLQTGSGPTTTVSWIKVGLGVLLLLAGVRDWRKRPKAGEQPTLPKWMTSIECITPPKAGGLGLLLSAVNPKNLLLIVAGGMAIDQGCDHEHPEGGGHRGVHRDRRQHGGAAGHPQPGDGPTGTRHLDSMNGWLRSNNATVMATLILVIGFVLIGKGISGFG
jgi:hypothetical protein